MTINQLRAALDEIERRYPNARIDCSDPYCSITAQPPDESAAFYVTIDDDGTVHWE